jgi:hypothetical protein
MSKPTKPYDNPRIFWDVDHEKMDTELRANFIIERVFDRGDVQDIRNCRGFYGDEKIKEVLVNAKFLSELTLEFVSNLFAISKLKFRCYTLRQSTPGLLPY